MTVNDNRESRLYPLCKCSLLALIEPFPLELDCVHKINNKLEILGIYMQLHNMHVELLSFWPKCKASLLVVISRNIHITEHYFHEQQRSWNLVEQMADLSTVIHWVQKCMDCLHPTHTWSILHALLHPAQKSAAACISKHWSLESMVYKNLKALGL